jgi:rfaE bifunctional protein kinase chain/domain
VLVIGDVMLDEYIWGDVQRVSPEAPVPVVEFTTLTHVVGGAANAAANVASLGGHVLLGGIVGDDAEADILRRELAEGAIEAHLVASDDRPTTTKSRIIGNAQQVLRIDREERKDVSRDAEAALLAWASSHIASMDCLLISDYGKGVVTRRLCQSLIELSRAGNKPVVVDPKGRDYSRYEGATVVTPNIKELDLAVEPLSFSSRVLEEDVRKLRAVLPRTSFVVTRGQEGVSILQPDKPALHLPAHARTVFDVTGAGDTFVGTLALSLATGASLEDGVTIANTAAGIVVGKVGTATVDLTELDSDFGT